MKLRVVERQCTRVYPQKYMYISRGERQGKQSPRNCKSREDFERGIIKPKDTKILFKRELYKQK